MVDEIIKNIEEFGLKINHLLDKMNDNELENIHQAITEYKENKHNSNCMDYI